MIENVKVRWGIMFVVVATALIYFLPNLIPVGEKWPFSKRRIVYGLDIQGGLHLVMGVDVQGVITEKTARLARGLQGELTEQGIATESVVVPEGQTSDIIVTFNSAAESSKLDKFLSDYYPATLQLIEQNGNKATLRFYEAKILEYKKQVLDQAIEVIRNRIDEFGVAEPSISAQGSDRILVQLPGIQDAARAKELINRTARLEFRPVVGFDEISAEQLQGWVSEAEKAGNYALGKDELAYGDYIKRINEDLKGKIPADTKVVFQKIETAVNLEAGKMPMLVKNNPVLGGDQLEDAAVRYDQYGKPYVYFKFSVEGRRQFAEMTGANVGKLLAIVLDDVVQSAPNVNERIDSADAQITLGGRNYESALQEAQFIATTLRAGALPAALEQLEERSVGPTLGADSIKRGAQAGVVAAIVVLLFMLIYYRFLGFVADIALILNVLFILASFTVLGATMTLPGVAGIALTVGMAVDANIIIFERIKEELARGTGLKAAIKDGFNNALSALIDANVMMTAVCIVLIYFGTGPVRGFAVTLIIGTITSMFCAIFVTRTLIDFFVNQVGVRRLT